MATLRPLLLRLGFVLGAAALAGYVWLFHGYEAAPVDPAWEIEATGLPPAGTLTVRYTGCATLVFSDGDNTIVIDGWFSRPGPLAVAFGTIAPDLDAIDFGLEHNALTRADVVFPVHSHYDHAMDSPEVARRLGAVLMGSESTAMIGRGWGLPESQIRVVEDRERIEIGAFTLVPIASRHFQFADPVMRERALGDPDITEPVVPPVPTFAYKVGVPWALLLEHPQGRVLIQGSAGYIEGALEGVEADVVFLGAGGLGSQTEEYVETYWRETVERTGARRVIPVHWDGLMSPIEGPFRGPLNVVALVAGGSEGTRAFLEAKRAAHPEIRIETLPRYAPIALF